MLDKNYFQNGILPKAFSAFETCQTF